jgi:Zn-dependent membrane protease YugP
MQFREVLSPVTTFSSGLLFALIGLVGIVSAAIAFGWVGMSFTKQQNITEAKVPASGQPALR